jgi:uncharacterized protein (TIGR03089 family)
VPTFAETLTDALRHAPGRPLVTFYDHATSERVELSVTTYANWVAKAASLLAEEADLERGGTVRIDLPPHWMSTVFAGAAWTLGAALLDDAAAPDADVVVCGPDTLAQWATADGPVVLACSLDPLGRRFDAPVPDGVHDVGAEIWSQPDAFTPWDPPGEDDPALLGGLRVTQGEMMQAAAAGTLLDDGGRLLSVANPASPPSGATFTEPLARGGSLVLVRHPDPARLERLVVDERITHRA